MRLLLVEDELGLGAAIKRVLNQEAYSLVRHHYMTFSLEKKPRTTMH